MKKDVDERLRESKKELNAARFSAGQLAGREWAEDDADALDLERLAKEELAPGANIFDVAAHLGYDDVESLVGARDDELLLTSPHFAEGFVTEALVVFAEHFHVFEPTTN